VGLGEEGFFRGWLYPMLTDVFWDSKVLGAFVSSIVFAAAHIPSRGTEAAQPLVMLFRMTMGMIFCIQLSLNQYDMRKSIFGHTWFDVFVDNSQENGWVYGSRMSFRF